MANESCHLADGNNAHYNHVMLVLGIWQIVIAALAIVVAIIFGLLGDGHLGGSHALNLSLKLSTNEPYRSPEGLIIAKNCRAMSRQSQIRPARWLERICQSLTHLAKFHRQCQSTQMQGC